MFAWLHAASGLSCLLSCRTTSQRITSKQLPAADGGVVVVVVCLLIPFFPSFLCYPCCTERVAVMTTFLSAIILDLCSQFLLRVPTSSRHIQCNFAFTHFLWVAVGCSVILGRIAPALLQGTTEGSITWNHEQLWWSQASEPCHCVAVMLQCCSANKEGSVSAVWTRWMLQCCRRQWQWKQTVKCLLMAH